MPDLKPGGGVWRAGERWHSGNYPFYPPLVPFLFFFLFFFFAQVTLVGEGGRKNLKAIVKRARRKPQRRVVPPDVVAKYVDAIKRLEPELDAILEEEELEKRVRCVACSR